MTNSLIPTVLIILLLLNSFIYGKEKYMTSEQNNIEIIKLIPKMYNSDPELANKIFEKNCIHHVNGVTEERKGPVVTKNALEQIEKQFSNSKTVFLEIIPDGNAVAVRWKWEAVNIQTKTKWTFNGNTIFHLKDGKVVEYWAIDDRLREMMIHGFTLSPPKK